LVLDHRAVSWRGMRSICTDVIGHVRGALGDLYEARKCGQVA